METETVEPKVEETQEQEPEKETVIAKDVPKEELDRIVRHHVWGAMGVGLIPIPAVDMVGLAGIQLNLARRLAQAYGLSFSEDSARNIITTLVASFVPAAMAFPVFSLAKMIPLIGQSLGAITMPALGGAATYALGKVFIQHFACGGTILTFDPEKVKAYYAEIFKEGCEESEKITRL